MKQAVLDGRLIQSRQQVHASFARQLDLPAWYGANLDALHDCLTSMKDEVRVVLAHPDLLEKTLGSIREVQARGAKVILLCPETAEVKKNAAEHIIRLPAVHELLLPLTALVALQLFAYYAAVQRGCDVDKPRNLAKSVTVE